MAACAAGHEEAERTVNWTLLGIAALAVWNGILTGLLMSRRPNTRPWHVVAVNSAWAVLLVGVLLWAPGPASAPAAPASCPSAAPTTTTPVDGGVDVPTIPQPDGSLLIDAPGSRMDRAVVSTQQDANDLWRILYGAPWPAGR